MALALRAHRRPSTTFVAGWVALTLIALLSAVTHRSPILEGWPIKVLLVSGLTWGALASRGMPPQD